MNMNREIVDAFFEDDEERIKFLYTGKNNVIGLRHFDASLRNRSNYQYIRIGRIIPDEKALSTDIISVDESLTIILASDTGSKMANVHIHGLLQNRSVIKNSFSCTYSPLLNAEDEMTIYLVKEPENGIMNIGIWVKTENYSKVFTNIVLSKAQNTVPINVLHLDSLYKIRLLKDTNDIELNKTASNDSLQMITDSVAVSNNLYGNILSRLDTVEGVAAPKFQYGYIIYPEDFVPDYASKNLQVLPPRSINYTTEFPFMKVNTDRNTMSVFEEGIYQFSLTTGIKGGNTFVTSGFISMGIYINEELVSPSIIKTEIINTRERTLSSNLYVQKLSPTDKISVKFNFETPSPDSVSFNHTYLSVFRVQ